MHDNWLILIALSVSGIGVAGLLFVLAFYEPELTHNTDVPDGTHVRVTGPVQDVQHRGNVTIITILQPLDIVVFEPIDVNASCIRVMGEKGTYRENTQVIAKKIVSC